MGAVKRNKYRNCGDLFVPDARNRGWRKYCFKPSCRKASKAASQRQWLNKPENQDYFRCPDNMLGACNSGERTIQDTGYGKSKIAQLRYKIP